MYLRKLVAPAVALTVVFMLSAPPANAQSLVTPPVVVDRTAVTLTYQPNAVLGIPGGQSTFDVAVSWQLSSNSPWDVLVSYISPSGFAANPTAFRIGGRYHTRPLSPTLDVYGTVAYFSPSTGNTRFELGGGFTDTIAPGFKLYYVSTYNSQGIGATGAYISTNLGVQYEVSRQFAIVVGLEGNTGNGYLGFNFNLGAR